MPWLDLAVLWRGAGVVRPDWNGYNVIHDNASRVAALDLGFQPSAGARAAKAAPKVVYLLGADDWEEADVPKDAFVIYQVRLALWTCAAGRGRQGVWIWQGKGRAPVVWIKLVYGWGRMDSRTARPMHASSTRRLRACTH